MGLDLAGLEDERLKFRLTDNDVKREGVGVIWLTLASWGTPSRKYCDTRVFRRLALPI